MSTTALPARQLGELMCEVTEQILWLPAANWVRERLPGSTLACRTGSGQATYHRFDPRNKQHQITYGVRMIEAKHCAESAHGWLSSREIQRRGYFDGEVSPLNLLAHTCCHEFAHLLQQSAGKRFRGSVHNRHFYNILDNLHQSGGAEAARQTLAEKAEHHSLRLSDTPLELPGPVHSHRQWQVGEPIVFGQEPKVIQGRILRVNRKTCTVEGTGAAKGVRYRVPMQMLRSVR
ncbi:hypothetical protein QVZ43_07320 [Marinobacter sp. chi1]|uniref:SprT-like domain-containing protein n=1 Tax=Marinobacter suaedae TaxID=3057675 RepID=A0ABT8VZX6_9GAMM|nr:hypothetical protein [Marinobacter sp. chi1]MDO3721530.1 hypothetical protein [Marinobacter sp. chi1]